MFIKHEYIINMSIEQYASAQTNLRNLNNIRALGDFIQKSFASIDFDGAIVTAANNLNANISGIQQIIYI